MMTEKYQCSHPQIVETLQLCFCCCMKNKNMVPIICRAISIVTQICIQLLLQFLVKSCKMIGDDKVFGN